MATTSFKVVFVGAHAVGKSSIVSQIISSGTYSSEYEPTECKNTYTKSYIVQNESIEMEIIDTSGQQQYQSMLQETFMTGDIFVIVYSVNNLESFNHVNNIRNQILIARDNNPFPSLLVGNKSDLPTSVEITTDKSKELAKQWRCSFMEVSAKNNTNIEALCESIASEYRQFKNNIIVTQWSEFIENHRYTPSMKFNCCDKKQNASFFHQSCITSYPVTENINIDKNHKVHKPIFVSTHFKIKRMFICKRFVLSILCGIFLPFVIITQTWMFVTYSDSRNSWIISNIMRINERWIVKNENDIRYEWMHHTLLLDIFGVIIGRNPGSTTQKDRKWFLKQTRMQKGKRVGLTILVCVMYAVCCFNLSHIKADYLESVSPFLLLGMLWITFSFWIAYEPQLEPEPPSLIRLQSVWLYFGKEFNDATSAYSLLRSYISCRYKKVRPSILSILLIIFLSVLYSFVVSFTQLNEEQSYFMDIAVRIEVFMMNSFLLLIFMFAADLEYCRYLTNYREWMNDLTLLLDKKHSRSYFISLHNKSNALSWLEIRSYLLMEARLFWCQLELPIILALLLSILLTIYLAYLSFFDEQNPTQSMQINCGSALLTILLAGLIKISITGYKLAALQQKQQSLISRQSHIYGNLSDSKNDYSFGYLKAMINEVHQNDICPRLFNVRMNSVTSKFIAYVAISVLIISLNLLPLWYPIVIVSIGVLILCISCIIARLAVYCSTLEFSLENGHKLLPSRSNSAASDTVTPSPALITDASMRTISLSIDDREKYKRNAVSIPYWGGKKLIIYQPTLNTKECLFNYNATQLNTAFEDQEMDIDEEFQFEISEHKIQDYDQATSTKQFLDIVDESDQKSEKQEQSIHIHPQHKDLEQYYQEILSDRRRSEPIPIKSAVKSAIRSNIQQCESTSVTPLEVSPKMWSINGQEESPICSMNLNEDKHNEFSEEKKHEPSTSKLTPPKSYTPTCTSSTPIMSYTSTAVARESDLVKEIVRNEKQYTGSLTASDEYKHNETLCIDSSDSKRDEMCKLKFKQWLCEKVNLKQYLSLFERFEYNDIRMIEDFNEEIMKKIGIKKELHCKLILKKALQFKKSQQQFDSLMNSNKQLDIYKDEFESNGIITMTDLRSDIVSYSQLGQMLGIQKETQWIKLWSIIYPSDLNDI